LDDIPISDPNTYYTLSPDINQAMILSPSTFKIIAEAGDNKFKISTFRANRTSLIEYPHHMYFLKINKRDEQE
jgi:hypothetical protein